MTERLHMSAATAQKPPEIPVVAGQAQEQSHMDGEHTLKFTQPTTTAQPAAGTVVVHAAYPLWRKHLLVTMARARELQDDGHKVVVTHCNATAGTCAANYAGNPAACLVCRNRVRSTAAELGLQTIPLAVDASVDQQQPTLPFSEQRAVLEGVQSGVISTFRTMPETARREPLIRRIKRRYFSNSTRLLKSMKNVVAELQPERIEVFNGRHGCSKFAVVAARSAGIDFTILEVSAKQHPFICPGYLVHDRRKIQERIMQQPADYDAADAWYTANRRPRTNKYAKRHSTEFTPPTTSPGTRKVSIFLSSQDEFASLGKDWISPFLDYGPIVEKACRENPDMFFVVRFHPNQADMAGDLLTPFKKTAELPNVRIHYADEPVNSYSIMEWSDIVVTFGSTITVEACWAGKPVITLGPSFFDNLQVAYTPRTVADFVSLLRTDLQPHNRDNAARYACFRMFDQDQLKYVRHTGKTMVENGFTIRYPWLGQLARTTDDLICNAIKMWAGHRARRKKSA
ncbi:MAG: hypothetical protein ACK56U_10320 [Planctomyces sp.]